MPMTTAALPAPRTVRTMCPMNCHPTFCGMQVTVENEQLLGITGDKDNPDSRGFLCVRGQAAGEIINNPRRLLYPLVRRARGRDEWDVVGWDEALARIVNGFRRVGRDAVGFWAGHGTLANDYGIFAHIQLLLRFANRYGCHWWDGSMICWGLGGFGLGLTGLLEANTKEDMGEHADLILFWGANIASQPNSGRHVAAARRRGAKLLAIDVRVSESCKQADEYFLVKPGTDAALALAMMHVIIRADLTDRDFIERHTTGFAELSEHVRDFTPAWAESITGLDAARIVALARAYANTERAMIVLGGSSPFKDEYGWQAARAVSCLPALTGKSGKPGCGLGPRHAAPAHGFDTNHILDRAARPPGAYIPNQMPAILEAMEQGRLRAFMLLGTNMLSSYADAGRVAAGLDKMDLVVGYDLFMNDMLRQHADVVLPATAWLEDVGIKATHTHLYLMDKALPAPGEARPLSALVRDLAARLGLEDFYPWESDHGHIDAVLDHPCTGHATVESLRAEGGIRALDISHVAYPDHRYTTPSGKLEFYSARAAQHGLPALPEYRERPASDYPLELRNGRTLTHFHAFYDHGRALPSLNKLESGPTLWIAVADAEARGIADGAEITVHNQRASCRALARVTAEVLPGTVWIHDGWPGFNQLSSSARCIPDSAVDMFPFSVGQSAYDAWVEVGAACPPE
ncbi:MAG: molybdopterin-dependent oxidoreductase [Gammaproteobacteria bacterium]|nr:molybdopterin-dependent oxidoreductase [Gammaproteobacteria bacterium]